MIEEIDLVLGRPDWESICYEEGGVSAPERAPSSAFVGEAAESRTK
jgi:hypothetical protein